MLRNLLINAASIVLSGFISWAISFFYFRKGNRDNVKSSLLYPVKVILRDFQKGNICTKVAYGEIDALINSYCSRYLNTKERTVLEDLRSAFKAACERKRESVQAEGLFEYFLARLKQEGIDAYCWPAMDHDSNIVDYDIPPDVFRMPYELEQIICEYGSGNDLDKFRRDIEGVFSFYKRMFKFGEDVVFFDGCSIEDVIADSDAQKNWDEMYEALEEAKKNFLGLRSLD